MSKYEVIERLKLYYFQPSYWKKLQRVCRGCGARYKKYDKVNHSLAFELPKNKFYYHLRCLPKDVQVSKKSSLKRG